MEFGRGGAAVRAPQQEAVLPGADELRTRGSDFGTGFQLRVADPSRERSSYVKARARPAVALG